MATAITLAKGTVKYADQMTHTEYLSGIATGAGAIDHTVTPGAIFKMVKVELHLSAAPTTSENFQIKVDAGDGAVYDVVLLKNDLSVGSITDLVWVPEDKMAMQKANDVIAITWTNTDTKTWGLRIGIELL